MLQGRNAPDETLGWGGGGRNLAYCIHLPFDSMAKRQRKLSLLLTIVGTMETLEKVLPNTGSSVLDIIQLSGRCSQYWKLKDSLPAPVLICTKV